MCTDMSEILGSLGAASQVATGRLTKAGWPAWLVNGGEGAANCLWGVTQQKMLGATEICQPPPRGNMFFAMTLSHPHCRKIAVVTLFTAPFLLVVCQYTCLYRCICAYLSTCLYPCPNTRPSMHTSMHMCMTCPAVTAGVMIRAAILAGRVIWSLGPSAYPFFLSFFSKHG